MGSWDCDPPYAFYPNGEKPKPEEPKAVDKDEPILFVLSEFKPIGGGLLSVDLIGKTATGQEVSINVLTLESELRKLL